MEPPAAREEIPSIDEFLDELPAIEDFLLVDEEPAYAAPMADYADESPTQPEWEEPAPLAVGADGWATGSWQSFDWSSAASLNRSGESGETAWQETDWPSSIPGDSAASPTPDEVADALDGIARRIRSGELVIDNLKGTPPEAAMAAALAVILRMRG